MRLIMNYYSNRMGVKWDNLHTIETYNVSVRSDPKILVRYRPESVRDEVFTRNINKHYVEKDTRNPIGIEWLLSCQTTTKHISCRLAWIYASSKSYLCTKTSRPRSSTLT